jgi:hypothetical protein
VEDHALVCESHHNSRWAHGEEVIRRKQRLQIFGQMVDQAWVERHDMAGLYPTLDKEKPWVGWWEWVVRVCIRA